MFYIYINFRNLDLLNNVKNLAIRLFGWSLKLSMFRFEINMKGLYKCGKKYPTSHYI